MKTLTETQEKILKQINDLLGEHFDAYTLAIEIDLDEMDDEGEPCTFWRGSFGGGRNRVKGLTLSQLDNLREIKNERKDE
jgi:hypothetical protein